MTGKVIFRYLTPVFNQSQFVEFEHSGHYKDATFSISLKGYGDDPSPNILPEHDLNELLKYGSDGTLKNLWQMHRSERFFPPLTNVVLVVDVIQPLIDDREVASNTRESSIIFESIISALRLHASKGLAYEYSYIFRSPPICSTPLDELPEVIRMMAKESPGCASFRPHTIPVLSSRSRLGSGLSVLRTDQYDDCRKTFHKLLEKEWDDTDTFDKVLQLALEYHRTSFTLENIDHAFLVLMVLFEALFKKESEGNAGRAAGRIAKLLALVKGDKGQIKQEFFDHPTDAFSKIRNKIAHGNPDLDYIMVKEKYLELYNYITKAIIDLLNLQNGIIGMDYYNDLNSYVETRFSSLPVR
ncbi:MAG: hypothetical protein GY781_16905 [Gammaproteobacteria bacterium]|nr:hypothetical protein [Gammaproteobacteria bacterium]